MWHSMIIEYLAEKDMVKAPDCSYAIFIKKKLPEAKKIRHEKIFPEERQKAFLLGAEMVKSPWKQAE